MAVAEEVDPPGADAIQVAASFGVVEPGALGTRDGDGGRGLVPLHLGAGVPHSRKAAGGKRLSHRAIVTPQRSSQLLRGHVVAQLDLAVGIVHEDQLGPVLGHVGLMHLGK